MKILLKQRLLNIQLITPKNVYQERVLTLKKSLAKLSMQDLIHQDLKLLMQHILGKYPAEKKFHKKPTQFHCHQWSVQIHEVFHSCHL